MYILTLLYSINEYNIGKQLYTNKKKIPASITCHFNTFVKMSLLLTPTE